jgi:hypothetical protein
MKNLKENSDMGFSNNVERGDNMPIVASKYGFREEIIDGRTYLVAMTKEEYLEAIKLDISIPKEYLDGLVREIENDKASCFMYTSYACATPDNCQWCSLGNVGPTYYCYCREWPI